MGKTRLLVHILLKVLKTIEEFLSCLLKCTKICSVEIKCTLSRKELNSTCTNCTPQHPGLQSPVISPFWTLTDPQAGSLLSCTCMCPSVSLQVRTLCVHFVASLKITSVDTPFSGIWRFRPSLASCALNTKWRN